MPTTTESTSPEEVLPSPSAGGPHYCQHHPPIIHHGRLFEMGSHGLRQRLGQRRREQSRRHRSGPRVTSLDQPGKVTIGTDGSLEIGKSSCLPPTPPPTPPLRASSSQQSSYYPTVSGSVGGDVIDISNSDNEQQNNIKIQPWRNRLTHNGGEHHCIVNGNSTPIIRGGGQQTVVKRKLPVSWSQD